MGERFKRLQLGAQDGFTLVETLVAAVILMVGLLGVFLMIDIANGSTVRSGAREGAVNLAREMLEDARAIPFAQLDQTTWATNALDGTEGRSGPVIPLGTNGVSAKVNRRGFTYGVSVTWCTVDDGRDGYGSHPSGTAWCAGGSTGTTDGQPQDLKRVIVRTSYKADGRTQPDLVQTGTFGSGGAAGGPKTPTLQITSPTGLDAAAPVVTANPSSGNVVFQATSVGASTMKFTVDGADQTAGITNNGNGTWTFNWNVVPLKDGVYAIGATPIDAIGTYGPSATLQVKLARGAPSPITNVVGGYNYVNRASGRTLVVEGAWDASPDGSVTGYRVLRGSTVVCPASLELFCIDFAPATSGSSTYTIQTLYTDASGTAASISTPVTLTAPSPEPLPTQFFLRSSRTVPATRCYGSSYGDLLAGAPTAATSTPFAGGSTQYSCTPALGSGAVLGAGSGSFDLWYTNTSTKNCNALWSLARGASPSSTGTAIARSGLGKSPPSISLQANKLTPVKLTVPVDLPTATTFAGSDDQLMLGIDVGTSSCGAPVTLYSDSTAMPARLAVPTLTGSIGLAISRPAAPTGLTATPNADGTTSLSWSAPAGTPAADFYRVYRDGNLVTDRFDTAGGNGTPVTWQDTATGGTSHSYRVTAVSAALAESDMLGPVTG